MVEWKGVLACKVQCWTHHSGLASMMEMPLFQTKAKHSTTKSNYLVVFVVKRRS